MNKTADNTTYMREYMRKNMKERYYDYYYNKFRCECGGIYSKNNLNKHKNTKKHKKYILNNNETNKDF